MRGACIKCPNNAWMLILFFLIGGILLGLAGYILNKKQMVSWPLSFFSTSKTPFHKLLRSTRCLFLKRYKIGLGRGEDGRVGGGWVGLESG